MRNIAIDNSVIKSGNDTTITATTFGEIEQLQKVSKSLQKQEQ